MSRKRRIEIPGFHHINNISIDNKKILKSHEDKDRFIEILQEVSNRYNLIIHSYCITKDSYHLLIQNFTTNLSLAMRQLNSMYSMYYNKKYSRSGTLWQDRYKSWYISNIKYLHTIYRYIESTPVFEELSYNIGEYKYSSSYRIFNNNILDCSKNSFILNRFTKKELAQYLEKPFGEDELKIIDEFRKEKFILKKEKVIKEKTESLYTIFRDSKSKKDRNKRILLAFNKGYKQSEISLYLNLSSSSISKIIQKGGNSWADPKAHK